MIKIDIKNGFFEVSGESAMILTEVSEIVKELYKLGIEKKQLEKSFKHAFMTNEELEKELLEKMKEIGIETSTIESLKKIFKHKGGKNNDI